MWQVLQVEQTELDYVETTEAAEVPGAGAVLKVTVEQRGCAPAFNMVYLPGVQVVDGQLQQIVVAEPAPLEEVAEEIATVAEVIEAQVRGEEGKGRKGKKE